MDMWDIYINTKWPGGKMSLRGIALDENIGTTRTKAIQEALEQFAAETNLMFIWYTSVMSSREVIRKHLTDSVEPNEQIVVATSQEDGTIQEIHTRVKGSEAADTFSARGDFEREYARSFVISVYSLWEDFTRPRIADILEVDLNVVTSDLMGEWRHLRHWVVHPNGDTARTYFDNAERLPQILDSCRTKPAITMADVLSLTELLNSLTVFVNPNNQEPLLEVDKLDPEMQEKLFGSK